MSKKKPDAYVHDMRANQFERIMQILHGEYDFDPSVSIAQQGWWFQNAMHCVKGFAYYDFIDGEAILL